MKLKHALVALTATAAIPLRHEEFSLAIQVATGTEALRWSRGAPLGQVAADFAALHGLQGGEGCEDSACVTQHLVAAMELETLRSRNTTLDGHESPVWSGCGWHARG